MVKKVGELYAVESGVRDGGSLEWRRGLGSVIAATTEVACWRGGGAGRREED